MEEGEFACWMSSSSLVRRFRMHAGLGWVSDGSTNWFHEAGNSVEPDPDGILRGLRRCL